MVARRNRQQGRELETYRAKRQFDRTPEPSGARRSRRRRRQRLRFCVQKHLASHLHYDFRLEYDGVLLSWAVPKGPSLRPADKRLAMRVEDHPIEYGDFEGVIPEGYGAGIVVLWDQGTWKPLTEDVEGALASGELKFELDGYKLKGSWVLVRTSRRGEGESRSWLLIKHRDEWSGDLDITEFAPRSVKSDGDLEDVLAAQEPEVWQSHLPARGGATGRAMAQVIRKAAQIKAAREQGEQQTPDRRTGSRAVRQRSRPDSRRRSTEPRTQ